VEPEETETREVEEAEETPAVVWAPIAARGAVSEAETDADA
jgi:hypothetical protein